MNEQVADLTNCDREPIHIPGSIQPHGAMLVVDAATGTVAFASTNCAEFMGRTAETVVGCLLRDTIGSDVAHQVSNAAAKAGYGHVAAVVLDVALGARRCDVTIHKHNDFVFLELEPAARVGDTETALSMTQALMRRIGGDTEIDGLVKSVAKLVRALLGYDRVMVYQFLHNGAGRVVAEAKAANQHSFLGQHFPFADIPVQARELYRRNWTRLVGDASSQPVVLHPALRADQQPVDMSYSHLRSVSPIHCEYLRNMGIASSMSISVVVGENLWGLVVCHHDTPKVLSIPLRVATELFAQYFSLQIAAAESRKVQRAAAYARRRLDAVMNSMDSHEAIEDALHARIKEFATLIPCDGAGVWSKGRWTSSGIVPAATDLPQILDIVRTEARLRIWETQQMGGLVVSPSIGGDVAGLLAIPVSMKKDIYLLLFRNEEAHDIEWAGDPAKREISSVHGNRLTPRTSFELWRQEVRGRSLPWTEDNTTVAEALRSYLRDFVAGQMEEADDLRSAADRQRELFNAELNHRNKNVLALVKSIARQTGIHATNIEDFAISFEGRLNALSYAHDMSFHGHDGGELRALIEAEANMHRFEQLPKRFKFDGPTIGLSQHAFSVFALLFHEMITNAAKFGALSSSEGLLEISWELLESGDCLIRWVETGGPTVAPPRRKGFGTTLIDRIVVSDLGGDADLSYMPLGLRAQFLVPARHLHVVAPPPRQEAPRTPDPRPLEGLSILLVEDQALIAMDIEEMLNDIGAREVVTYATLPDAFEVLAASNPDIAVLDFNLGSETSEPIATALAARNIPFIFSTGYREGTGIPGQFADVVVVRKPTSLQALTDAMHRALKK
jgi:light-regulated signal transduction histidine kinase (bacteriophytochrome)